jgi:hypothetical protein
VARRLGNGCFNWPAAALNLAHHHRVPWTSHAEIRQALQYRHSLQSIPYFLLNKKSWQLAFPTSKMSHPLRDLITDRAERAAAGHAQPFLQCSKAP